MTELATDSTTFRNDLPLRSIARTTSRRSRACASHILGATAKSLPCGERSARFRRGAPGGGQGHQRRGCRHGAAAAGGARRLESRSFDAELASSIDVRFPRSRRPPARFTPFVESSMRAARISCATDSRSSSARRPSRTTITSTRSTFRAIIPHVRASIHFGLAIRCCFAHTRRRCRFERCKSTGRRSPSSLRENAFAEMPSTRATSFSFIKSKDCSWPKASISDI